MRPRRSAIRELLPSHGQCTQAWSNISLLMDKFGDRTAASINGYSRYPGRYAVKETNAAPVVADIGPQSHRASLCQFARNEGSGVYEIKSKFEIRNAPELDLGPIGRQVAFDIVNGLGGQLWPLSSYRSGTIASAYGHLTEYGAQPGDHSGSDNFRGLYGDTSSHGCHAAGRAFCKGPAVADVNGK